MKKEKALRFLIICLLCFALLSGCGIYNNEESLILNYKNDTLSNQGLSAAVYDDRIYYISNELGAEGIYSMSMDGSDIRIEAENPNIKMIQILNDKLYFSGLYEVSTIENIKYWNTIYYGDLNGISFNTMDKNKNIIGFYIDKRDNAFIDDAYLGRSIRLLDDTNAYKTPDIMKFSFKYNGEKIENGICNIGELKIISSFPDGAEDFFAAIGNNPYFINTDSGEVVLKETEIGSNNHIKAYYIDDENIYCSYNEMVVVLGRENNNVKTCLVPDGLTNRFLIDYITAYGDKVYIIANLWRYRSDTEGLSYGEKLYVMDPNTYECSEILNLNAKQRILGLYEDKIILLDNGEIFKLDLIDGKTGNQAKLCDAPDDIYSCNYVIDCAGDWMFIYKAYPEEGSTIFGQGNPGQQLLLKINIANGVVTYNDLKLDFSVLDKYKVN